MGWFRPLIGFVIALFAISVVGRAIGLLVMAPGGSGMMFRLLFAVLIVVLAVKLFRPRRGAPAGHGYPQYRGPMGEHHNGGPTNDYRGGTPEEILRGRFARGELTRDQYREAIVEILKDRYVTGELTLEEYEARVDSTLDVARTDSREREATQVVA